MNEHASTAQQVPLTLPSLPKFADIAQTFWEELLLGRLPAAKGGPVSPSSDSVSVGGTGSRWS